jgi:carboxymethylenebutenolidase
MRRLAFVCACALLVCVAPVFGQDWAKANLFKSPRHGEYVTIDEPGGRKLQAWVVYPQAKDKTPVVVMVHEIFGLSDWAREMADEVAGAGYIVVEPDLLSGDGPGAHGAAMAAATPGGTSAFPSQDAVINAVSNLPESGVMTDLDAAADFGKKLPASDGKLFVAGFCWGGGQSFQFATHRHDLSAAFVFYGPPPPMDAMKNVSAPVYGFYAEMDARVSATIPATQAAMKADGKVYEPVVYDGAGHGFMRLGESPDASAANTAARQAAFRRFIELLGGVR